MFDTSPKEPLSSSSSPRNSPFLPRPSFEEEPVDPEFTDNVRVKVVSLLLFLFFYGISYKIIRYYKTLNVDDELFAGKNDFYVYRITVWICSFSLAISLCSIILVPFSLLGVELLVSHAGNYYLQWYNWPLITFLWQWVFTLSNVSLFVLLPFSYFFLESHGLGRDTSLIGRVYEAMAISVVLIVIALCSCELLYYFSAAPSDLTIFEIFSVFTIIYVDLPFLYSCVSLLGALAFMASIPYGYSSLFRTIAARNEEENYFRNYGYVKPHRESYGTAEDNNPRWLLCNRQGFDYPVCNGDTQNPELPLWKKFAQRYPVVTFYLRSYLPTLQRGLLTGLLLITVIFAGSNVLKMATGFRALPGYEVYVNEAKSKVVFGLYGAMFETVIIFALMVVALHGFYQMSIGRAIRPVKCGTSMTCVIFNCSILVFFSSALPVATCILGVTSFDLLGSFGTLAWLSSFPTVFMYNVVFIGASFWTLKRELKNADVVKLRRN
ncbi:unnamed protein product, partial [Mesorhabditis spiculigera]